MPEDDEISLADLLQAFGLFVQETWRLLVSVPLLSVAVTLGVGFLSPKYESEGLLRTPEFTLEEWRTLESLLRRPSQVERYLSQKNLGAESNQQLKTLSDSGLWEKRVQPKVAITDKDRKTFDLSEERPAETLGLTITTFGETPVEAQQAVYLVADYIKESQMWLSLRDWISAEALKAERGASELEKEILVANQLILDKQVRIKEMKALIPKFSQNSRQDSPLMFSTKDDGARYLPPAAQAIALETEIQDAREKIRFLNRQKEQLKWLEDFFVPVREFPQTHALGSALLGQLRKQLALTFPNPEALPSSGREIFLRFGMHLLVTEQRYSVRFAFNSPPSIPKRSSNSETAGRTALIVALLSLLLTAGGLLVYRSVRSAMRQPAQT
jgi:hypothetical protein